MMASSEPPYLPIGTEVSAKYRGAFCEAKVKKIVKSVKCRVFLKETQSALWLTDEHITGPLKLGAVVEVKHPDTGRVMEATIKQMNDYSMYTVVFDDADERTLRRTQLCLKGDKHFIESETLDNLPLSNPEHFGTPVIKRKRGRGGMGNDEESDESSDEETGSPRRTYRGRNQDLVGKVMFYDSGDRKKTYMVPVLVTLPDAHSTELRTKDHLLVRSFKDSKFLAIPKKELTIFTREAVLKNEDKSLKPAMEKALLYIDNREVPPTWNKDELLGPDDDTDGDESSDDDEPTEEKDHFVAQLYKFCDDRGTPINKGPSVGSKDLNLYKLFKIVQNLGGYNRVTNQMKWRLVYSKMLLPPSNTASTQIKNAYKKYLHAFEDFYRKLGSSMGTISRPGRNRHGSGRSILNFRDRDGVKNAEHKAESDKEKGVSEDAKSEFDSDGEKRASTPTTTPKRPKSARIKAESKEEKVEEEKEKKEIKKEDKKETKKEEIKEAAKKVEDSPKKVVNKKPEEKEIKVEVEKKGVKKPVEAPSKAKKEVDEEKEKELKDLQKKISRRRSTRTDDKTDETEDNTKKEKKEEDGKKEKKEDDGKKDKKDEGKDKKKEEADEKKEEQEVEEKSRAKKKEELDVEEKTERKTKKKVEVEPVERVDRRIKKKIDPNVLEEKTEKVEKTEKKVQKKEEVEAEEKGAKKKEPAKRAVTPKATEGSKDGNESDESDETHHPTSVAANTHNLPVGSRLKVRYGKGKNQVEYEAKIIELGKDPGPKQYLVHYQGWNNRHDEWVKQERIVKVIERSDSKKKSAKTSPKPVQKVVKKKLALDKPPASPSSVKSDSSNQGTSRPPVTKAAKVTHTPVTTPSAGTVPPTAATAAANKPRPTRSNSIEINFIDGLPAKRRPRKMSGMFGSANGSDSEGSDKSDNEEEKKFEKEEKSEAKTTMPAITPKKHEEEPNDLDSSVERSPPQLSKMTDLVKEKVEPEEKVDETVEKFDVKDEPVAPVLKVMEIEKNSEPILEKLEAQLIANSPVKVVVDAEVKEKEVKRKEPLEKRGKKAAQTKIEPETLPKKAEKPKEENVADGVVDSKEESMYDFKDEPEEELKVRDRKKPVVVLEEVKVDEVQKPETVPVTKPSPQVVKQTETKEELDNIVSPKTVQEVVENKSNTKDSKDLAIKPIVSLFDEKETAKSDSEVERRGRKKKITVKCEPKEVKKPKLNIAEKKINELTNANVEKKVPIISVSPERKPFITLAEKKQGFSPMVKKSPSVQVVKCSDADNIELDLPSVDHDKEKNESKEEVKRMPEMVVVHKESPVKTDIVLGRKVELIEQENGDIEKMKNCDIDDDNKDGRDEIGNDVQSVKKKVRKKTKKKLEMDELERGGFFSRKISKTRGPVSRLKPGIGGRRGRELNNREKEKEELNTVKDSPFDIDLRCEEQIRSRSASPERISLEHNKIVPNPDAAGFESLFEAVECRLKESQQGVSASQSKEEKTMKSVYENTPPTTPEHDSDEASHQNSQHDQIKIGAKFASEVSSKTDASHTICNESPRGNQSPLSNNSSGSSSGGIAGSEGSVDVPVHTSKRRRESDEPTPTKRRKRASRGKAAANRAKHMAAESDSEEATNPVKGRSPHYSSDSYSCKVSSHAALNRSPRPSKYNFNLEEGKYLEGQPRISFLVDKIQEIRRIYMNLKSEVACIDRRRKRIRRREKEGTNSSSAVEVECS